MRKVQVGIDLGTTNTLACCRIKGRMKLLKFRSSQMLPSVRYVEKQPDGTIKEIVGRAAQIKGMLDPDNFIRSSKTYIGLTGENKKTWTCHGKTYTPTDVAARILKEVHQKVRETYDLEEGDIVQAVITIPEYFTATQSDETKQAGKRAGMEVLRIITEPVAAAVSAADDVEGKIFVVDLGGGTFDVSALEVSSQKFSTLAVGGERRLGGDDFDECLVKYFLKYIESDLSIDLSSLERSGLGYEEYYVMMSKIRSGAVELKEELSESEEVKVDIPGLFTYGADKRRYDFSMEMDRETFNSICAPLFEKIIQVIDKTVKNSDRFQKEELKKIFLVGGSCYIPKVQEDVERYFGLSANSEQDRATQVAMGAGKIADAWDGFTPEKNRVDPFDDKLQDIISHAMGIEVLDDDNKSVFSRLLAEGTPYPCTHKEVYRTAYDNQDSVIIKVYEKTDSDSPDYIEENHKNFDLYGSFVLEGIDKAPAGQTEVCVTFDYDHSRTLHVTAEDTKSHVAKQVELHKGQIVKESRGVKPTDFYVLLDVSGSMDGKRMEEAQNACRKLIKETLDLRVHRLGLITFGSQAKLLCSLTQDKGSLLTAVKEAGVSIYGSTNMSAAIRMGRNELRPDDSSSRSNSSSPLGTFGILKALLGEDHSTSMMFDRERDDSRNKAMILITDGDPDNRQFVLQEAEAARNRQIAIATIGVYGAVEEFLRKVSDDSSLCFMVDNIEKLSDTFGQAVANLLRK